MPPPQGQGGASVWVPPNLALACPQKFSIRVEGQHWHRASQPKGLCNLFNAWQMGHGTVRGKLWTLTAYVDRGACCRWTSKVKVNPEEMETTSIQRHVPGICCHLSDQNSLSDPKPVIWGERDHGTEENGENHLTFPPIEGGKASSLATSGQRALFNESPTWTPFYWKETTIGQ